MTTKLNTFIAAASLAAVSVLAQAASDKFMGDWQGTVTVDGQEQNVCAYLIPLGDSKYEARFVSDFSKRGPYLFRLKGAVRNGMFKFMDDIPFDVSRIIGATDKGVVFDSALWAGQVAEGGTRGVITGKKQGSFQLKQSQRVSPNLGQPPPAGAVVLFDGKSLDGWTGKNRQSPAKFKLLAGGVMEVSGGDIMTREKLGDCRLHLEFKLPYMPTSFGQGRANSGVYPLGRYEIQVLDSYGLEGFDNECGGIYQISRPAVNACAPPLQWQSYDITFKMARFDAAGKKTANARVTLLHNGVLVQDNTELPHVTGGALDDKENQPDSLILQDHGNPVQYRNIWAEKLN